MLRHFKIYSKLGCPFCDKVKNVIEMIKPYHSNVIVDQYQLDVDFTKEEFYAKFGEGSTFPQVVYNGDNLGGCVDTVKFLKENSFLPS